MSVNRFKILDFGDSTAFIESESGDYVAYEDYSAIEKERDELKAKLKQFGPLVERINELAETSFGSVAVSFELRKLLPNEVAPCTT